MQRKRPHKLKQKRVPAPVPQMLGCSPARGSSGVCNRPCCQSECGWECGMVNSHGFVSLSYMLKHWTCGSLFRVKSFTSKKKCKQELKETQGKKNPVSDFKEVCTDTGISLHPPLFPTPYKILPDSSEGSPWK